MGLIAAIVNLGFIIGLCVLLHTLAWGKFEKTKYFKSMEGGVDDLAQCCIIICFVVSCAAFYGVRFGIINPYYVPPSIRGLVVIERSSSGEVRVTPAPYGVWRADHPNGKVVSDPTGDEDCLDQIETVNRLHDGSVIVVAAKACVRVVNPTGFYKNTDDASIDDASDALERAALETMADPAWAGIAEGLRNVKAYQTMTGEEPKAFKKTIQEEADALLKSHYSGVGGVKLWFHPDFTFVVRNLRY